MRLLYYDYFHWRLSVRLHNEECVLRKNVLSPTERSEYQARAEFRFLIRTFLAFTEQAASEVDLTARQHEALIAIVGSSAPISITELSECLVIKHHSAVGLVDRLENFGLISREQNPNNYREVRLYVTPKALKILQKLAPSHRSELRRMTPLLNKAVRKLRQRD
jgi:DNA-binding MarR family transcriptional regulator